MSHEDDDEFEWNALDRETGRGFAYAVKWVLAFLAVFALIAIGWVSWVEPVLLDKSTDNQRQSHQYVETQRTFLLQKLSACQDLDVLIAADTDPELTAAHQAQPKAYIREMKQRVALIDEDEVPVEVRDYLEEKAKQ